MDAHARYIQDLSDKRDAAMKRVKQGRAVKAIKDNAPELLEIIDTEISIEVNKGYGTIPLSYEAYLESHGAARGMRRVREMFASREVEEVSAAQEVKATDEQLQSITKK